MPGAPPDVMMSVVSVGDIKAELKNLVQEALRSEMQDLTFQELLSGSVCQAVSDGIKAVSDEFGFCRQFSNSSAVSPVVPDLFGLTRQMSSASAVSRVEWKEGSFVTDGSICEEDGGRLDPTRTKTDVGAVSRVDQTAVIPLIQVREADIPGLVEQELNGLNAHSGMSPSSVLNKSEEQGTREMVLQPVIPVPQPVKPKRTSVMLPSSETHSESPSSQRGRKPGRFSMNLGTAPGTPPGRRLSMARRGSIGACSLEASSSKKNLTAPKTGGKFTPRRMSVLREIQSFTEVKTAMARQTSESAMKSDAGLMTLDECSPICSDSDEEQEEVDTIKQENLDRSSSQTLSESEQLAEEEPEPPPTTGCAGCRYRLRSQVVETSSFDAGMTGMIMCNAIVIGFQTDWSLQNEGTDDPVWFLVFDRIFSTVFALELVLKLVAFGWDFVKSEDSHWNLFDTALVFQGLFEDFSLLILQDGASSDFGFLRIVRLLRLLRVLRLLRLIRSVNELRSMVSSISSSLKSLIWTLVLILMMIYMVAVTLGQVISFCGQYDSHVLSHEEVVKYWGTIPKASLTLYMAITGGISWHVALQPLYDEVTPWLILPFTFYIAFAVLAMMNVITGVFVESALQTAKNDREKEMKTQVSEIFSKADINNNGQISWDEFATCLENEHMVKIFEALGVNIAEAGGLFMLLDADGSGTVEPDEFLSGCFKLHGQAAAIDLEALSYFQKRMFKHLEGKFEVLEECLLELNPELGAKRRARLEAEEELEIQASWSHMMAEGKKKRGTHIRGSTTSIAAGASTSGKAARTSTSSKAARTSTSSKAARNSTSSKAANKSTS